MKVTLICVSNSIYNYRQQLHNFSEVLDQQCHNKHTYTVLSEPQVQMEWTPVLRQQNNNSQHPLLEPGTLSWLQEVHL